MSKKKDTRKFERVGKLKGIEFCSIMIVDSTNTDNVLMSAVEYDANPEEREVILKMFKRTEATRVKRNIEYHKEQIKKEQKKLDKMGYA